MYVAYIHQKYKKILKFYIIIKYKQLVPTFGIVSIHFLLKPFAKQSTSGAFLRKRHLCDIRISANSVHSALKNSKKWNWL